MRDLFVKSLTVVVCLPLLWVVASQTYAVPKIPVITKEDLKERLDNPGLIIIDVRVERGWQSSDRKIKGAVWEDPDDVSAWAGRYSKDKNLVLYCS